MEEKKITKKQFNIVYKKYPPNGWIRFGFKYFSKETEMKDMSLRNNLTFFLLGLFLLGFFGTVLALPFIKAITISYSIILTSLVLYLFSVVLFNNLRLKKIRKILGISKSKYIVLIRKFYS